MSHHRTASTTVPRAADVLAGEGLLRVALKLDAVVTGANGAAYLVLAGPLEDALGLPASLLRPAGAFLLAFAAAVWVLARAERLPRAAVLRPIAVNAVGVADSLAVLALGAYDPTAAGTAWIALQSCTVAGFAALQVAGRRRARRP